MIIILEGVNKTGKTSFFEALAQKLNMGTRYYNRKYLNDYKDSPAIMKLVTEVQLRTILELTPSINKNIIFDRFHITEKVYGKIDRGYDMEYFDDIEEELVKQKAKLIYFVDDINEINSRNGKDMTDYMKEFDKAVAESKIQKIYFNYKDMSNEDKMKELLNFLEV